MEYTGHKASYPTASPWKASLAVGSHPPRHTPRNEDANQANFIDGYPFSEAGSMSCINPSQLSRSSSGFALPQGPACMDNLEHLN
ncbi:hypothetical protein BU24DRAFT_247978 [Aaosphaeria arxii CBS 175.79]|uniref:Uncharacterized protein n=1 Tax=Aaosphaeria arxii CBS 175.79 TaxID=1450172 RepID=A0A6A5XN86_9PLEO|nr:uncharacterized protein BU24DRAFT_247978 [Aaosphaeria arxii CBS 175.79]KAF2013814.1 hypothetical protein BU24DRAFT_247978 [Aaosphaeria arxii CBS 175.79]